ncbi:hypothetical protein ACEQ6A_15515 [Rhizobium brockwellii]|uniref:hypothetical protein n=1 Tax=Rhizobium brockwellii TaxID=3019932 RepID=UPI003F9A9474
MIIEIEQDETKPRGGYAVLRFHDQSVDPGSVTLNFQPFEDVERGTNWPKTRFESVETRLVGDTLEVVVGPEVVNNIPADISLRVVIDALSIDEICWWPSLSPEIASRPSPLPHIARPEVANWVKPLGPDVNRAGETTRKEEKNQEEKALQQSIDPPGSGKDQEQAPAPVDPAVELSSEDGPVTEPEPEEVREPDGLEKETSFPRPALSPAEPKRSRAWMALAFLAGLIIGGGTIYGWQSLTAKPAVTQMVTAPQPPPSPADRTLLTAVDTPDFDPDGNPIFSIASREWLRRGDVDRANGNLNSAALNYRRALRTAWHEDNRELGDVIGRLAAVLSSNGNRNSELGRTIRILMELAVVAGDPAGLCRLALLDQNAVGGTPDPAFADGLRSRASKLASRFGPSDLPQECR